MILEDGMGGKVVEVTQDERVTPSIGPSYVNLGMVTIETANGRDSLPHVQVSRPAEVGDTGMVVWINTATASYPTFILDKGWMGSTT